MSKTGAGGSRRCSKKLSISHEQCDLGLLEHELPYVLQLQKRAAEVRCWFDYFAQEKAQANGWSKAMGSSFYLGSRTRQLCVFS